MALMNIANILKNYNLSLVLLLLFLLSWGGQAFFQWQEFTSTQYAHGLEPTFNDFYPEFFAATLENWQSEFLQLLSMVVLTSFLIHKGSAESKDSTERMEKKLTTIEKAVKKKKRG